MRQSYGWKKKLSDYNTDLSPSGMRRKGRKCRWKLPDCFKVLKEVQQGCWQILEPELPSRLPGGACLVPCCTQSVSSGQAAGLANKGLGANSVVDSRARHLGPFTPSYWAVGDMRDTPYSCHAPPNTHRVSQWIEEYVRKSFDFFLSFKYWFYLSKKHKI